MPETNINKLFFKQKDFQLFYSFVNDFEIESLKKDVFELEECILNYTLKIDDGSFFPLPYSTIRTDFENNENSLVNYLKSVNEFNSILKSNNLNSLKKIIEKIKLTFSAKILEIDEHQMLPIGVRILNSKKKGIDIHCENAFLNQLNEPFKQKIIEKIDLENAISIYIKLEEAEIGGELIVFEYEWKDVKIELNKTSYEERHDMEGSIFTSRGWAKRKTNKLEVSSGNLIAFRAAQIWHAVNKIEGEKNRVTIGCFIAKGKDGNNYFWA